MVPRPLFKKLWSKGQEGTVMNQEVSEKHLAGYHFKTKDHLMALMDFSQEWL